MRHYGETLEASQGKYDASLAKWFLCSLVLILISLLCVFLTSPCSTKSYDVAYRCARRRLPSAGKTIGMGLLHGTVTLFSPIKMMEHVMNGDLNRATGDRLRITDKPGTDLKKRRMEIRCKFEQIYELNSSPVCNEFSDPDLIERAKKIEDKLERKKMDSVTPNFQNEIAADLILLRNAIKKKYAKQGDSAKDLKAQDLKARKRLTEMCCLFCDLVTFRQRFSTGGKLKRILKSSTAKKTFQTYFGEKETYNLQEFAKIFEGLVVNKDNLTARGVIEKIVRSNRAWLITTFTNLMRESSLQQEAGCIL